MGIVEGIKSLASPVVDAYTSAAATLLAPVLRKALAEELETLNRLGDEVSSEGWSSGDSEHQRGESREGAASQNGVYASRAALHKAKELGIDVGSLEGSGADGMVTARDVLAAQGR